MKAIHLFRAALVAIFVARTASAATITFEYNGTKANGGFTISTGSFSFANSALSSITLSDLISFAVHQTTSNASGTAVGIFDFTQADLVSFAVSSSGGHVTSAMFETDFNLQTSSPTNTLFKSQNFIALSAATAKTQYQDQFFQVPPPPTNDTAGPMTFSTVPEPSTAVFIVGGLGLLALQRKRPGTNRIRRSQQPDPLKP